MGLSQEKLLHLTDGELMREVGKKNCDAFEIIYDRHSSAVYSLSYRIVGSAAAADDVCQETFMALWRSAKTYQHSRGPLRSWLLTIVHNRAIDNIRKMTTIESHQVYDENAYVEQASSANTEDDVLAHFDQLRTRELLTQLPIDQRKVVELSFYSGYSHGEIADHLGVPLGTVKGRMSLALSKMRQSLEGERLVVL